jgi:ABC-2 type transport system permease protein
MSATAPPVRVRVSDPAGGAYTGTENRFEAGASTQLLLFIFLTSLSGAVWLIETRRLGSPGACSPPRPPRGRSSPARCSGVGRSARNRGGDPLVRLVGTGAAVLLGSLCGDEQQAGPIALLLGLALATWRLRRAITS